MCLGCPANSSLLLPLPFWIVREEITDDARSGEEEEAEEEEEEEATVGSWPTTEITKRACCTRVLQRIMRIMRSRNIWRSGTGARKRVLPANTNSRFHDFASRLTPYNATLFRPEPLLPNNKGTLHLLNPFLDHRHRCLSSRQQIYIYI